MRTTWSRTIALPLAAALALGVATMAVADTPAPSPDLITGLPAGPTCTGKDANLIGLGDGSATYTLGIDPELVPEDEIASVRYYGLSGIVEVDSPPFTTTWTPAETVGTGESDVHAEVQRTDGTVVSSSTHCYLTSTGDATVSVQGGDTDQIGARQYRVPHKTKILDVRTTALYPRRITVSEDGKQRYDSGELAWTMSPRPVYYWVDNAAATTPGTSHDVVTITDWSGRVITKPIDIVTIQAASIATPTITTSTGATVSANGWVLENSRLRYRTTATIPSLPTWTLPGIDAWQTTADGGNATQIVSGVGAPETAANACLRTEEENDCGTSVPIDGTASARSDDGAGRFTFTTVAGSTWGEATRSTTVRVYPAATLTLKASGSTTVTHGQSLRLATLLREHDGFRNPIGGETLTVQFRAPGWTTWHFVRTVRSSAAGSVAFTVTSTKNGSYRVVHADRPGHAGPATSSAVAVHVRSTVTTKALTAHPRARTTTRISAALSPREQGVTLTLQRWAGSTWKSLQTRRSSTTGTATFAVHLPAGRDRVRVVKSETATYVRSVSATRTVDVAH
ncbi:MAG TPA: hypothetical protein VNR17_03045 [Luteimicrobium sp.]|nr:hypothetical protein [Luteimicrobium sp.]